MRPATHYFRDLLLETGRIAPIGEYDADFLSISTPDVLARIQAGDPGWESLVPPAVAEAIKASRAVGYRPPAPTPSLDRAG